MDKSTVFGLIIGLTFFIILTIGYAIEILAGNLRISNTNLSIRNSSTQRSA